MNPVRQWTGPLTQELVLKPGDFGLGHVPAWDRQAAMNRTAL